MIEICNSLRLIKRNGFDGDTWIFQELYPADTWKNRQVWKPVTKPLHKTEVLAWLSSHALEAEVFESANLAIN